MRDGLAVRLQYLCNQVEQADHRTNAALTKEARNLATQVLAK